jgi:hypothetical protein
MTQKRLSRKEARKNRKKQKQEKDRERNLQLANSIELPEKRIRSSYTPDLTRIPRLDSSLVDYEDYAFEWNIELSDTDGIWSWGETREWTEEEYENDILGHFELLRGNTWREILNATYNGKGGRRKKLNKYQSIDSICEEAQNRWVDLEIINQFDILFRFRQGTYKRTWGLRYENHFFLVWHERNHQICPIDND